MIKVEVNIKWKRNIKKCLKIVQHTSHSVALIVLTTHM